MPLLLTKQERIRAYDLWGHRKEKKRRKKREKEEREGEEKGNQVCSPCAAERNHQGNPSVLQPFEVISWDLFPWNLSSMCWEVDYIDFTIYFMKKVIAFTFWKLLFISVLRRVFIPEIVLIVLGAVDLQIGNMMAFWKALYVDFVFIKCQLMTRCILGAIGLEVRYVPGRSEPE